jgi:hypothetical protein
MQRYDRMGMAIAIAMLATSCAREDALTADPEGMGGSESTSSEPNLTTHHPSDPRPDDTTGDTSVGTDSADDGSGTRGDAPEGTGSEETTADPDPDPDTSTGAAPGDSDGGSMIGVLPFSELFEGPDGGPWPIPWEVVGSGVTSATIQDGRGRLDGAPGLARMVLPGFDEIDSDMTATVTFDDWTVQGFGLYARQNGGALQETDPPGLGYCVYVEGGYMQSIGVWREIDGVEELIHGVQVPGGALQPGVPYQVRLQVQQEGAQTRLRARMWTLGEDEPAAWQVDALDATPALQGLSGSFAVDVYNYSGAGGVLVDDLHIAELPDA